MEKQQGTRRRTEDTFQDFLTLAVHDERQAAVSRSWGSKAMKEGTASSVQRTGQLPRILHPATPTFLTPYALREDSMHASWKTHVR